MRTRLAGLVCGVVAIAAAPVDGQERPTNDVAHATLCMVDWSIGPIWNGERVGCPPVLQALPPLDRPCRTRYSTGVGTREEALLRYDAAGRLREVEHVGRGRASYVYDAQGRLTRHTRQTMGYSATTTTFTYGPGLITDDTTTSNERHRWQVEAGRVVTSESLQGAPDAPPMATSRSVVERGVFVGLDTVLCRTPARDGVRCDPTGPAQPSRVMRDRAGRIVRGTIGDLTEVYTYDARGRVTRIQSSTARFRDQMLVDYVCPAR
jgi:YD repeat-containing protein